jgi:hypothetical protein
VVAEAGIVADDNKTKPRKKSATVDERMAKMFLEDPERVWWPASKWATALGCSDGMVKQTTTWRNIMTARALLKADKANR